MTTLVRPVILSGGAGTRLWPLSTPDLPKQFVELLGRTLFDRTLHRLDGVDGLDDPIVVVGESHVDLVESAMKDSGRHAFRLVTEPVGRNTGPAVVVAALLSHPHDVLAVLPSDHLITDEDGFRSAAAKAIDLAVDGHLVTFGVTPDRAEIGFGYIEVGEDLGGSYRISGFKEKPNSEVAERLLSDGAHLWNSGIFVFEAATVIAEVEALRPELIRSVRSILPGGESKLVKLPDGFSGVESISFDHAVMELTSRGVVVPVDVGWSDVGSYQAMWEASERDPAGNVVSGDVNLLNVRNSFVRGTTRKIAIAEVDGVVVVETAEAVLVVPLEHSRVLRQLVGLVDESPGSD